MRQKREYRATYTVLRVDPLFLPMSKDAKLYWHTAKLELPVSGIGVCLAHTIAGLASMTVEEAQTAELELAAAGWLKRAGAILWIVNGLRHTPNLKPKDIKHRLHIQRLLKDLPSDSTVVAEFRAYYPEWLDALSEGVSKAPSERPSEGPAQGPSKGSSERYRKAHGSNKEVRSKKKVKAVHGSSGDEPREPKAADSAYPAAFEDAWTWYPPRPNNPKRGAYKAWTARLKDGATAEAMLAGVQRYAAFVAATLTEPQHVMQAKTFFGPDERWADLYEIPAASPAKHVAGSIGGTAGPLVERARVLFALGREYDLFAFNGNKAEYGAHMDRAQQDARAGDGFRSEAAIARMWEGIGSQTEHFAITEISRRLEAAGVKVA